MVGKICQPVLFFCSGEKTIYLLSCIVVFRASMKKCKVIILRQAFKKSTVQIFARQQKIDDNIIF